MEKRDLLLHYDEVDKKIVFYFVSLADSEKIKEREFGGGAISTQFLKQLDPAKAEESIGCSVLTLLDYSAALKLRDYESLINEEHILYVAELEKSAAEGSTESQYMLFIEYHGRALKECSLVHLAWAEELLNLSAKNGYPDAISRLTEDWHLMKGAILRKVERNKEV